MGRGSKWQYFDEAELTCQCGCGRQEMNNAFMTKIVAMRRELGFPFKVTSAYRCPEHNIAVSHTGATGPHTTGRAIDIEVNREYAYRLLDCALRAGMTGIGVQQKGEGRFLHLDDLEEGIRPTVWSY